MSDDAERTNIYKNYEMNFRILHLVIDRSHRIFTIPSLFCSGSDPGFCLVSEYDPQLKALMSFGRQCATRVFTQREAIQAGEPAGTVIHK